MGNVLIRWDPARLIARLGITATVDGKEFEEGK